MSKYNVGDKFIAEIKKVDSDGTYKIKDGIWLVEGVFDHMHKVDSNMKIEDITDMIAEYDTEKKGYNKGLQDAWELMKKLIVSSFDGGLGTREVHDIFDIPAGKRPLYWIMKNYSPQEALAKLKAYEKEQAEIKVGDVVIGSVFSGVVTGVDENRVFVLYDDGSCGETKKENLKKTGKHIDIHAVLQEIGGE